jgi:D-alanine-D-alanine ligase
MILADSGEIKVLEVNTIPGLTATSLLPRAAQAKGMDYTDLCVKILKLALSRKA